MKQTSLISTALATGLVLLTPAISWSHDNSTVLNSPEIASNILLWHHGGTHHGGYGGCW